MQGLASFIQAACDLHTHYHKRSHTLNSIDKIFFMAPTWVVVAAEVHSTVERSPVQMSDQGLSDHVPIFVYFSFRPKATNARTVIPGFVMKSPRFTQLHTAYCEEADLLSLPGSVSISLHKLIVMECARTVRNEMQQA